MEFFNSTQRCKLKLSLLSTDRFSLERARVNKFGVWDDIVNAGDVGRGLESIWAGSDAYETVWRVYGPLLAMSALYTFYDFWFKEQGAVV
jgi:hypothetical protein